MSEPREADEQEHDRAPGDVPEQAEADLDRLERDLGDEDDAGEGAGEGAGAGAGEGAGEGTAQGQ